MLSFISVVVVGVAFLRPGCMATAMENSIQYVIGEGGDFNNLQKSKSSPTGFSETDDMSSLMQSNVRIPLHSREVSTPPMTADGSGSMNPTLPVSEFDIGLLQNVEDVTNTFARGSRFLAPCATSGQWLGQQLQAWLAKTNSTKGHQAGDLPIGDICGDPASCKQLQGAKLMHVEMLGQTLDLVTNQDDSMTQHVVIDELQRDVYGMAGHRAASNGTMIDIGGHIGTSALLLKKLNPDARVISFEPTPENRFYFEINLGLNGLSCGPDGIELMGEAVGGSSGFMNITYNAVDTTGSSAYIHPIEGPVSEDHVDVVDKTTLDAALQQLGVAGQIDFLKMDCEGCEYEIIPSLSSALIQRIHWGAGEVHSWIDSSNKKEVWQKLCRFGWQMQNLNC